MDLVELTAGLKSRPFKTKPYAEISWNVVLHSILIMRPAHINADEFSDGVSRQVTGDALVVSHAAYTLHVDLHFPQGRLFGEVENR